MIDGSAILSIIVKNKGRAMCVDGSPSSPVYFMVCVDNCNIDFISFIINCSICYLYFIVAK